jgi:hypothetical protein
MVLYSAVCCGYLQLWWACADAQTDDFQHVPSTGLFMWYLIVFAAGVALLCIYEGFGAHHVQTYPLLLTYHEPACGPVSRVVLLLMHNNVTSSRACWLELVRPCFCGLLHRTWS